MTLPSGSTLPSSSSVLWRASPTRVTCAFAWPDLLIVPRSIKGLGPPPPLLLVIQLSFSEQKVLLTQPYTIHPKQLSNRHHQQQHYLPLNTTPALSTIRDIPRVVISYSGTTHNPQLTFTSNAQSLQLSNHHHGHHRRRTARASFDPALLSPPATPR